jgi:3-isopropylmalate dehydratase small subunit
MAKVISILGDRISTDIIYPDDYLSITDPMQTPQYAFANDNVLNGQLTNKMPSESIVLVSGMDFGCGLPREQAVSALKGLDIVVIAKSVSSTYKTECSKMGFVPIICPTLAADVDDELEIQTNKVINKTKNIEYPIKP